MLGDRAELHRAELTAADTNWLAEDFENAAGTSRRCYAQIRYNAPARPATLDILPSQRLRVTFEEPQFGVAPGQAVVCFDERVWGGGWIE